jgi:hyaluronoglucosaminidase
MSAALASTPYAGIIEGFFGKGWDWSARASYADFLATNGYSFYIYAPKSEPFLRRRWREALPESTLEQLQVLARHYRALGVSLGVGLTPYEIYRNYDDEARRQLRAKVEQLNLAEPHLLCILFDDMRGDVENLAEIQARVAADASAWSTAKRFIVCPTYYSFDARIVREFGPPPRRYLEDLGRALDSRIDVFWTGEKVISDSYSAAHLSEVANTIGRKVFIWDNSVANDAKSRTNRLFVDPCAGPWRLPAERVAGVAFNLMNEAYLSRLALSGFRALLDADPAEPVPSVLATACEAQCGEALATLLREDLAIFQTVGLDKLDAAARDELIASFQPHAADPYAAEILGWLRDEYQFDPLCLTD